MLFKIYFKPLKNKKRQYILIKGVGVSGEINLKEGE